MTSVRAALTYSPAPDWQVFGAQHVLVLGIALILCVNLVVFHREARRIRADLILVACMLVLHGYWVVAALTSGFAQPGDLLPLYTCDASIIGGVIWCFWKPRWLGQLLFYWAFLGGVVTLLAPDTFGYALPHFAATYTLAFHVLLLLFGLEIWAVERVRPSWSSLLPAIAVTALLIPPSLWANARFGSDYMFVSRSPAGIFTFLNAYDGAERVLVTIASGVGLMLVCLLVWFALEALFGTRLDRAADPDARNRRGCQARYARM